MFRNELMRLVRPIYSNKFLSIRFKSSTIDTEKLEEEASVETAIADEEAARREEEIEQKRNKSRLKPYHRNIVFDKEPYPTPEFWYHGTLQYLRRSYGRYGAASGVDPSICWPVKQELEYTQEYERVAYPFTIPQMIEDAKCKRHEKEEAVKIRQQQILERLGKLDEMKADLKRRIEKKENEARAAKDKKQRLIEEVRAHFGFTVDPKDERFKELLDKKEKEQKKADKEARKKMREEKLLARMLSKKPETDKTSS